MQLSIKPTKPGSNFFKKSQSLPQQTSSFNKQHPTLSQNKGQLNSIFGALPQQTLSFTKKYHTTNQNERKFNLLSSFIQQGNVAGAKDALKMLPKDFNLTDLILDAQNQNQTEILKLFKDKQAEIAKETAELIKKQIDIASERPDFPDRMEDSEIITALQGTAGAARNSF